MMMRYSLSTPPHETAGKELGWIDINPFTLDVVCSSHLDIYSILMQHDDQLSSALTLSVRFNGAQAIS